MLGRPVRPEISGGVGELSLEPRGERWIAEARWQGATPSRDLLVRLPQIPSQLVHVEEDDRGDVFFAVSEALAAAGTRQTAPAPKRLALAWDASGSRQPEATDRKIAFLQKLFAAWPEVTLDVVVFRDRPEPAKTLTVRDGAGELLRFLSTAPADGGTRLAALDLSRRGLPHPDDALWLLLTDGLATLGEKLPALGGVPVVAATGHSGTDPALLRHLAAATGGAYLDLVALGPEAAADALVRPPLRLVRAEAAAGAAADIQISSRSDPSRAVVTGRLLGDEATLTLVYGRGHAEVARTTAKLARATAARMPAGSPIVARAWAQERAEILGLFPEANAVELLTLGRRFGLVTAQTSLLVLERLDQYVRYEVEPPLSRGAMREQYLAAIAQREKSAAGARASKLEAVVRIWEQRVAWWDTDFRRSRSPSWDGAKQRLPGTRQPFARPEPPSGSTNRTPAASPPAPAPMPPPHAAEKAMERAPEMQQKAEAPPRPSMNAPAASPRADRVAAGAEPPPAAAKSAEGLGPAGRAASVRVKPWDPDALYLASLRRAAPGEAYAVYLAERPRYATSPSFFLDCSRFFFAAGERELGLRVVTNLAELRIDDATLLRVLAWRLGQEREVELAAEILERVRCLRPEEPQSLRDLALALAERAELRESPADAQRAVDLLYEVVTGSGVFGSWDRFPEIEVVALEELNRLLARVERRGWSAAVRSGHIDPRLRRLLDVDLRIVVSWDADQTDVDLHVYEPTGEEASYRQNRTAAGGLVSRDFTQGYGPEEYLIRRAVPGPYSIRVQYYASRQQTLVGPATVTATVFTNYGRPNETRQVLTLRMDRPRDTEEVGVVTFGAPMLGRAVEEPKPARSRTATTLGQVRRGMTIDQVTAALGQPDAVTGGAPLALVYRMADGTEVRVCVAGTEGVVSVRQRAGDADLELLP